MSRAKIPFPVKIPFVERLGLELHACAGGASELRVDLTEAHMNSWEVAHGGVLMTMLDVAMATAARSHAPDMGVVTVEMKTSFMQPAQGPLVARGRLLHRTATLAFTEATVHDAQGRLCCQATGTFKVVRRLPVDGRQVHALKAVPTD